ncbi:MAG: RtcB family protein [Treponema sp.]|nr:RtcB family protein [Treponema sp.]
MNPILLKGACNEALIYARNVEASCEDQLMAYLNHELFSDTKVRIMPDVHVGKGTIVGFTCTRNGFALPSLIGVDIGCGVSAYNIGRRNIPCDKLDAYIRKNIPTGMDTHKTMDDRIAQAWELISSGQDKNAGEGQTECGEAQADTTEAGEAVPLVLFKNELRRIADVQQQPIQRVLASLGTLGGGNHFIEIDKDEEKNNWLLIHSGSRNFGLRIAQYHSMLAIRKTPPASPLKYLSGDDAEAYYLDMRIAQKYASLNRALMAVIIIEGFFKEKVENCKAIDTVHNYVDFRDNIIRKGAVSSHENESVVIPFSMSEGAVIGTGRGKAEWNYSAPHGAGRKISRSQARGLSLDEYRKRMRGIWSSTISKQTLDESPMAYKRSKDILEYIEDTVQITHRLKPLYNFKAEE